jgi:hypothetical protein
VETDEEDDLEEDEEEVVEEEKEEEVVLHKKSVNKTSLVQDMAKLSVTSSKPVCGQVSLACNMQFITECFVGNHGHYENHVTLLLPSGTKDGDIKILVEGKRVTISMKPPTWFFNQGWLLKWRHDLNVTEARMTNFKTITDKVSKELNNDIVQVIELPFEVLDQVFGEGFFCWEEGDEVRTIQTFFLKSKVTAFTNPVGKVSRTLRSPNRNGNVGAPPSHGGNQYRRHQASNHPDMVPSLFDNAMADPDDDDL